MESGKGVLEKFRAGEALVPPDVSSALAVRIRNAPTVSREILSRALIGYRVPSDRLQHERLVTEFYLQEKFGISTTDRDALAFSLRNSLPHKKTRATFDGVTSTAAVVASFRTRYLSR